MSSSRGPPEKEPRQKLAEARPEAQGGREAIGRPLGNAPQPPLRTSRLARMLIFAAMHDTELIRSRPRYSRYNFDGERRRHETESM
jgi:hypothetical protein